MVGVVFEVADLSLDVGGEVVGLLLLPLEAIEPIAMRAMRPNNQNRFLRYQGRSALARALAAFASA